MIGRLVDGKYRITKRLSAGGFGTVFIATQVHGQTDLGTVVLKLLHPELAHDPRIAKRFVTEARSARELTSPHVVRVFDLGVLEEQVPFMVQEYVVGEGLDAILHQRGPLEPDRVIKMGMQVAEAMAEAHSKGILHRDLKPENLRVQQTIQGDFVKVLDFGIARVEQGGQATNSFIGTPRYMAPEQIKQKGVDGRSDVFALGVILFECLTGAPPIPADNEMEYIHKNLLVPPRDVRTLRSGVPDVLADLVMQMMAKEREQRPAGMEWVYKALAAMPRTSLTPLESAPGPSVSAAPIVSAHPVRAGGSVRSGAMSGQQVAGETVTTLPARKILIFGGAAVAILLVVTGLALSAGSGAASTSGGASAAPGTAMATTAMPVAPATAVLTAAPATATPATAAPATAAATAAPATAAPQTAQAEDTIRRRRRVGESGGAVAGTAAPQPSTARVTKIDD